MIDARGLILGVFVSAANLNDRERFYAILDKYKPTLPRFEYIWVDGGCAGEDAGLYASRHQCKLEVVKRNQKDFKVLPRRGVVERTFAWLRRHRRLSKDYELRPKSSEEMLKNC